MSSTKMLEVNGERLLNNIKRLATFGAETGGGITRPSFSASYVRAIEFVTFLMEDAGLETRIDSVGNLIGRMGPKDGQIVMSGSHIDTVRKGGALDGAYGVLAAIEVAKEIAENDITLTKPFEVVAFIDEEGAFLSLLGSRAIAGDLALNHIRDASDWEGKKLFDALEEYGFTPTHFETAAYPLNSIDSFIELHIEQGPELEVKNLDIGIVEGIVGLKMLDFHFEGQSNHAGTANMNLRKDAFRTACEFITQGYQQVSPHMMPSSRVTFGTVHIEPNVANVVPRSAQVRVDCRCLSVATIDQLCEMLVRAAQETAIRYNVDVQVSDVSFDLPAQMDRGLVDDVSCVTDKLGYASQVMCSGAGHDAQAMASFAPSVMIFVPSIDGLSHHPDERTSPQHLKQGANVLLHSVLAQLS